MSFSIEHNKVIIKEPLVDIEKIFELANKLKHIESDEIIIDILNSYSLPSIIIGILRYLKDKGKKITILVYNDLLYSLFIDLGLKEIFKIKKLEKINDFKSLYK